MVVSPNTNKIAKSWKLIGSSGELARPKIPAPAAPRQSTMMIDAPGVAPLKHDHAREGERHQHRERLP